MPALRTRFALLLLLCFTRVLLPEAWVLSWHSHQHTTEEVAQTAKNLRGKQVLSTKHQHCSVDDFYTMPFQAAPPLELDLKLALQAYQQVTAVALIRAGEMTPPTVDYLRGPPSRS